MEITGLQRAFAQDSPSKFVSFKVALVIKSKPWSPGVKSSAKIPRTPEPAVETATAEERPAKRIKIESCSSEEVSKLANPCHVSKNIGVCPTIEPLAIWFSWAGLTVMKSYFLSRPVWSFLRVMQCSYHQPPFRGKFCRWTTSATWSRMRRGRVSTWFLVERINSFRTGSCHFTAYHIETKNTTTEPSLAKWPLYLFQG